MKDKKELKVQFVSINNVWRYGNIGMDQLAGYLRGKGFNVHIEYFPNKMKAEEIFEKIWGEYDIYGFSVTSANYSKVCSLCSKIKEKNAKIITSIGGGFATRYYREIFNETENIDYITLGDGEISTEILYNQILLNNGRIENINHYAIATKADTNNKHEFLNTEIKHLPIFDYYERDTEERNSRKVHCIQTKNNICTGNCSFCTERHGKIAYKDINSIVNQIELVVKKFHVKKIFFTDDNILDPNDDYAKQRIRELCEKIISLDLHIAMQCYIKAISLKDNEKDHELLDIMKKAGFVEIFVGLESGNQEDLNLYHKYKTVQDNYTVMKMLYQHQLIPIIGFIGFNPYSTWDKIEKNFQFLHDVRCTYLSNYLYCFVVINKYTKLYDQITEDGLVESGKETYVDIAYKFQDNSVREILEYVKADLIPKLVKLDYELDWVTYSYYEHKIWYDNIIDISDWLEKKKQENLEVIYKYLGKLFLQHDLVAFKNVEEEFWGFFEKQQGELKKIYDWLIELHY